MKNKFSVGDHVCKKAGYKYPGVVACIFQTVKGEIRYVVEAIHPDFKGMLHVFNEDQLVRLN